MGRRLTLSSCCCSCSLNVRRSCAHYLPSDARSPARTTATSPPTHTEMTCIGRENVFVLLRDHRLAVPILELDLSPLEFLDGSGCEMDLLVPR